MLRKIAGIVFLIVLAAFMLVVWLQNYYMVSSDAPGDGLVLEVWNKPSSRQVKELQIWKETILRFEQENPGIKIKGVEREFLPQDFVTAMAGGKGPDLMHVWIGMLPTLARQNFVAPMDEYIQSWDQKDYIPPIVWEPTKMGNKTYGIPRDTYFMVLFFRKDLFRRAGLDPERPPQTWAELADAARRLTKPALGQYGLGLAPNTWTFMDFVWQNGGDLVTQDRQGQWHARLDSPAVLGALQYWHDLKWKYKVLPPNALTSAEDVAQMFALGRVGMMPGVAMQLPTLINKYGLDFKDTGIAPLPAGPQGLQASHAGGEVFIINASISKKKRDAAWKYIRFELSPANQLWKWVRMNEMGMTIFPGAFSASTNLLNMPEFAMVKEELQHVRNEPHLPEWPLIKDALDNEPLQAVFIDKTLNLKTALGAFNRRVNERFLHTGEAPVEETAEAPNPVSGGNTTAAAVAPGR
ncbi:MAG: sugar ABC transporter substrate-binding protein [Candidatus Firestonebacteria bacterium]|nr:sugar ABC transporter substrate-binding protein [Candidatus Firestonebacteria bacterium]